MTLINNTHLNLRHMSTIELSNAIGHAEIRVRNALEDIEKLMGELASRETISFEPVQMIIPELDTKHMRY